MSRLDFAPGTDQVRITDIKRGLADFTPKPNKAVSLAALKTALKKAGYTLDSADITASGTVRHDGEGWWLLIEQSGQRFLLEGSDLASLLRPDSQTEVAGEWQSRGGRELIRLRAEPSPTPDKAAGQPFLPFLGVGASPLLTPVRTTSPGLTVYKGGAVTPRYFFTSQRLGELRVGRHGLALSLSYTPTPVLQLEADLRYIRTSFASLTTSGSGHGLGNITVWGKYRFHRSLEEWGDRQAALRVGFEIPSSNARGPAETQLAASEFVRRQIGPTSSGFAFHIDGSYSQAKGRLVTGGNIEGIVRRARDGFRLGHEIRVNADLEYVLLPLKYREPTRELFAILETTYAYRSRGLSGRVTVPGSSSSELYLAPALQYVAGPQFLVEASLQFPVTRNVGPQLLRTERNLLLGVRYLY